MLADVNVRRPLLALPVLALLGGCDVGTGTGLATGTLYVKHCRIPDGENTVKDLGSLEMPDPFTLKPTFFAGEPIEDLKENGSDNRLIIRLQSSGKRIEADDVLTFDIVSIYDVARCIRGAFKHIPGTVVPDPTNLKRDATGAPIPDYDPTSCDWSTGHPRIRVGPEEPVHANLAPRFTCFQNVEDRIVVVGTAVGPVEAHPVGQVPPFSEWESWIQFAEFGSAAAFTTPPEARKQIDPTFKVDFSERLQATEFVLELTDDRVLKAKKRREDPPVPELQGRFDNGNFTFDLQRGQGAQTFP